MGPTVLPALFAVPAVQWLKLPPLHLSVARAVGSRRVPATRPQFGPIPVLAEAAEHGNEHVVLATEPDGHLVGVFGCADVILDVASESCGGRRQIAPPLRPNGRSL